MGCWAAESEEHPGKGPQRAAVRCYSNFKAGWKVSHREGRWVGGEEAGRQARELVILLERRVLSAEGWY